MRTDEDLGKRLGDRCTHDGLYPAPLAPSSPMKSGRTQRTSKLGSAYERRPFVVHSRGIRAFALDPRWHQNTESHVCDGDVCRS